MSTKWFNAREGLRGKEILPGSAICQVVSNVFGTVDVPQSDDVSRFLKILEKSDECQPFILRIHEVWKNYSLRIPIFLAFPSMTFSRWSYVVEDSRLLSGGYIGREFVCPVTKLGDC